MNKYVNGNGFLTQAGQELLAPLKEELQNVIEEMGAQSESEMRTVGAILSKLVGDIISEHVQAQTEAEAPSKFDHMADDEFQAYLEFTYGPGYLFKSLTKEEQLRIGKTLKKAMAKVAEEMKEDTWNPRGFRSIRKGYID